MKAMNEKLQIDPDFKSKPMYTIEEYFDGLAKDLEKEFGRPIITQEELDQKGMPLHQAMNKLREKAREFYLTIC